MGFSTANLLDEFWDLFPAKPSDHERKSLTAWGEDIDDELLAATLNPDRFPKQTNGTISKPSLATLKDIAWDIGSARRSERDQAADALATADGCFYCDGYGVIYAIDPRDYGAVVVGRCKHCRAGEKGSGWLKATEPKPEIIRFARDNKTDCVWAVEMMIDLHEKRLEEA